jgi:DNA-binding beta-propeller fold protein YncE
MRDGDQRLAKSRSGIPIEKTIMQRLLLFTALCAASSSISSAGTLYLPAYPNAVIVFDEAKAQIVDRIPLVTGTPMSIRLAADHKKIYVTTMDHNGIEVIDVATRKVVNHFVLNSGNVTYRIYNGAPDPQGKLFYAVTEEITKLAERYEVAKPKYTLVDLDQQKIVKMVDIPKEEEATNEGDWGVGAMDVSPDGKLLYQFGEKITVLQTADFKVVDHIDLEKPEVPGMERVHFGQYGDFGGDLDLINEPGLHTAMFISADPVVHKRMFGLAKLDLSSRKIDYSPIGPAPSGMSGLEVTPDKKMAYTVIANGDLGNKHCEFWSMDLTSNRITQREPVPCRNRFTLGISSDGKKLYIYGAGFEIEVYDAATLKYEKTWDLNNDVAGGIVVLP